MNIRTKFRLTHRGRAMLLLAVLWFMVGFVTIYDQHWAMSQSVFTPELSGVLWMGTATGAAAFAFAPPGRSDAAGWTLLYIMPTVRATGFLVGWIDYLFPGLGGSGYPRGWEGFVSYSVMAAFVYLLASWPNPDTVVVKCDDNWRRGQNAGARCCGWRTRRHPHRYRGRSGRLGNLAQGQERVHVISGNVH